eukprot:TRINITY_DN3862_c0_g2_i4.p2 TRINITY_DN3862_c0_g2~~TRINITY_DN3862_c0_g2_i4.p2  ORF type:complete len:126 (+),score=17.38 TRINITY_DN3862_c0_g2_i4:520-897(+)
MKFASDLVHVHPPLHRRDSFPNSPDDDDKELVDFAGQLYVASEAKDPERLIFLREHGGIRSVTQDGHPGDEVYFMGVIDLLTLYNAKKKVETFFKSFTNKREELSSIDPEAYAERFVSFIETHTA